MVSYLNSLISTREAYSPTETFRNFKLCPLEDTPGATSEREEGARGAEPIHLHHIARGHPHLGEVSYEVPGVIIQNILDGPFWRRYQGWRRM